MWKAVNEACNRNSSSEKVQCIISDGIQHTTSKSIAVALNSFFASIGKRLADKITTTWSNCNLVLEQPLSQFQLTELEESFVLQQLTSLKTNKAIGLDKISARLLKSSANTITPSITKLLNRSILTGKFPKLWKCSKITALATGQLHRTIDLSLFYRHSVKFSRKPCIPSCTNTWLLTTFSQGNSLDSGRGSLLSLL